MGEPTEAEQIQIANNFLLNAPPGEFMEVVTDVRALLPRETMLNDTAPATFKEYNHDQMIQVDAPGGHKFLINKYAEVSTNQYIDHVGGQVHTFDHIKQQITSSRPISGDADEKMEPLRAALEKSVSQYVNDQYPFGTVGVYSNRNDSCFYVCINSTRLNPQNYWNGRWRSEWKVPASKSGSVTLKGRIRLQVHYYEDGNVQLHTDTTKNVSVNASSDAAAMGQAVAAAISKTEQAFHQSLDSSYAVMGETTCKALRRALPITGQKINWNLIHTYKLGQDISK